MRRRFFLAALLSPVGASAASASDGFPYGNSLVFAAYRGGEKIGHHSLRFRRESGQVFVSTSIDLAVRVLGLTVYRFNYRSHEVWIGNAFQSIEAETNDDGKKYTVTARRTGQGLVVDHSGPNTRVATASNHQDLQETVPAHRILPVDTLPSTHWNIEQVKQAGFLNAELGKIDHVQVANLGRQTIKTATGSLEATRYDYTGDIIMSQWFDDRARWVKATFQPSDNSTIEYILQE